MRNVASLFAFIDMLFNFLLGFTSLLILSFLIINPPGDVGKIDPPVKLMATIEWDDESLADIDIWVRGYDEEWVGFTNKDGSYVSLERDDRGQRTDIITVNGEDQIIMRNFEIMNFTELPAGEYFFNIHHYSNGGDLESPDVEVKVTVTNMDPHELIFQDTTVLSLKEEKTVLSFVVDHEGKISDIRTDVRLPHKEIGN